jgi:hypothetical protein
MSFPFAFTWLNALHAVRHFHNGADYILEILGQKWGALPNFLALRNRQNLVLGKNNQVSLTIGQILGTAAENTGWLTCQPKS